MKRTQVLDFLVAAGAALFLAPSLWAAEEFYLIRLREGQQSFLEKRYSEAATEYRIACFGLLEEPPLLSNCLAGLALSQDAAARGNEEVEATLRRFIDVERRFASYGKAPLPPAMQPGFVTLIQKRLAPETLALLPASSSLFETEDQKFGKLSPAERIKVLEGLAVKEPANAKWPQMLMAEQAARGDSKATIRWASKTLDLAPGSPEALLARGKAHLERKEYAKGKTDLLALPEDFRGKHPDVMAEFLVASVNARDWGTASELAKSVPEDAEQKPEVKAAIARIPTPKATATPSPSLTAAAVPVPAEIPVAPTPTKVPASTPEITPVPVPPVMTPVAVKKSTPEEARELLRNGKAPEAKLLLKDALQAAPTDREVRKALLEVSVMSRDWKLGAEQLPALDPMADSEAPFMFYASVCLFETGDIQKSRDYLKRARPRITSSPFVDYYSKKILGTP